MIDFNERNWIILMFIFLFVTFLIIYAIKLNLCNSQKCNNIQENQPAATPQKVCKKYKTLFGVSDDSRKLGAVSLQIPIPFLPVDNADNNNTGPNGAQTSPASAEEQLNFQFLRLKPDKSTILALQNFNQTANNLLFSLNDEKPFTPDTISESKYIAETRKIEFVNYTVGPENTQNVILAYNKENLNHEFGNNNKTLLLIKSKTGKVFKIELATDEQFETNSSDIDLRIRSQLKQGAIIDNMKNNNKNLIVTIEK